MSKKNGKPSKPEALPKEGDKQAARWVSFTSDIVLDFDIEQKPMIVTSEAKSHHEEERQIQRETEIRIQRYLKPGNAAEIR